MKRKLLIVLSLVMMFSLSATVFAAEQTMTIEEAKEYLENYYVTKENIYGKEYSMQYIFSSEDDLNSAAEYISDNGLAAFNTARDIAIKEVVSKEPTIDSGLRATRPSVVYRTVSGNGNHYVNGQTYGLSNFGTLGSTEYLVELGYRVNVANGAFNEINSISFDVRNLRPGVSYGNTRFPSYYTNTNASVTANFDITKEMEISIAGFGFVIKSETANEVFALMTNIR